MKFGFQIDIFCPSISLHWFCQWLISLNLQQICIGKIRGEKLREFSDLVWGQKSQPQIFSLVHIWYWFPRNDCWSNAFLYRLANSSTWWRILCEHLRRKCMELYICRYLFFYVFSKDFHNIIPESTKIYKTAVFVPFYFYIYRHTHLYCT